MGPKEHMGFVTPSPGAYTPEKSEKYLEEHIQHSMGIKQVTQRSISLQLQGLIIPRTLSSTWTSISSTQWALG